MVWRDTIRLIIVIVGKIRCKIIHLDIKSAFYNGELEKEIYKDQPKNYKVNGHQDDVYQLKKALHRIKQALRA